MNDLQKDFLSRIEASRPHGSDRPTAAAALIESAVGRWRKELTEVAMDGARDVPSWLAYELRVWELGESLRLILKGRKDWRDSDDLMDTFARIIANDDLGKGRQPFLEILARHSAERHTQVLLEAVKDFEIAGQAIKALRIAGVAGAEGPVRKIEKSPKYPLWIRREAGKYLQMLGEKD